MFPVSRFKSRFRIKTPGYLWTPAQLSTALWLDAADAGTVTLNGTTVSQWRDKSGNGKNVTQSTAINQPTYQTNALNGRNVVQYTADTTEQFFTIPQLDFGTSERSAFFVIKNVGPSSGNASNPLFLWPNAGNGSNELSLGPWISVNVQGSQVLNDLFPPKNVDVIFGFVFGETAGLSKGFIDGQLKSTGTKSLGGTSWANSTSYSLGALPGGPAQYFFKGTIAEVVFMKTAITQANRQLMEGYLAWKWGGF